MDLSHESLFLVRPPAAPAGRAAGARAGRRIRRDPRRFDQLSLADHIAFWRAYHSGRRCYRAATRSAWPAHVRVSVVVVLLMIALTLSAIV